MPLLLVAAYLVAINLATFVAFAWDKHCARRDRRRIPEKKLLTMAAIGGTIGAVVGQRCMRHKTCKEPFRTRLRLIASVQSIVLVAALGAPLVRAAVGTGIP